MNKAELIDVLTKKLDTDRRSATDAVEEVVDAIVRAVHKGDSVTITGFGVFERRRRAARVARNPRTGETVRVAPTSVPAFRPGAQFKAVISGAKRLPAEGPAVKRGGSTGRRRAVKKAARKRVAKKAVRKRAVKKAARKRVAKKAVRRTAAKKAVRKRAAKKAARKRVAKKAVRKRAAKKGARKRVAKKAVRKRAVKKGARKRVAKKTARRTAAKKTARRTAKKTARRAPAKRGRR